MKCEKCKLRLGSPDFKMFMVKDELWKEFGNGKGVLCIKCFSQKMGRKVELEDLTDAPVNDYWKFGIEYGIEDLI